MLLPLNKVLDKINRLIKKNKKNMCKFKEELDPNLILMNLVYQQNSLKLKAPILVLKKIYYKHQVLKNPINTNPVNN
jgi:hypothetical protein